MKAHVMIKVYTGKLKDVVHQPRKINAVVETINIVNTGAIIAL